MTRFQHQPGGPRLFSHSTALSFAQVEQLHFAHSALLCTKTSRGSGRDKRQTGSGMDAMQQQAMSKATNQRRDIQLKQINAALARIEADEYGDCLACGEEIAEPRLKLNPAVTLCINCAEKAE